MILQELCRLCDREGLLEESGYERKAVDFILEIDGEGRFVGLIATQDEKGRGIDRTIPALPKRSSGVSSGYLVDNAKYVLGRGMASGDYQDEKKREKKNARNAKCREAFAEVVANAATAETDEPELAALSKFYGTGFEANAKAVLAARLESEWTGSELIAFRLTGQIESLVHDSPGARRHWARTRAEQKEEAAPVKCLITGEQGALARLHPSVKRVPAGQSSGTSVVSFNSPAFTSRGAEQGANAPVSMAAAEKYTRALNHLLEGTSTRVYRQGVRLGPDAVTLLWTREHAEELPDLFQLFDPSQVKKKKGSQEAAIKLFEAAWKKGLAPSPVDETQLFALTLGGNASRVVIRDWFTESLGETKQAVRQFFDDIDLGDERPRPLGIILKALDPPGKATLEPALAGKLFRCVLTGAPLPRTVLTHALLRLRHGENWWENDTRTALVKAYLRRQGKDLHVSLDEQNKEPAYLLGRLFAVLEKQQLDAADGSLNKTIRDAYYASASSTPAAVFGRLLSLSMHHVSKLGGKAIKLEKAKQEIVGLLEAKPFPKTLSNEEQGLFAVGYYHQRKKNFTKASDEAAPEEGDSND